MRADDLERILNAGYAKSGNHFYFRENMESCCEYFPYRMELEHFKPDSNQRKMLKRFYRYLIKGRNEEEKKENET